MDIQQKANECIDENFELYESNMNIDVKVIPTIEAECPSFKNHSAIQYKDSIYLFGGFNGSKNLNKLHIFNLKTNLWEQAKFTNDSSDLPQGRNGHTSVLVGNKMYVIGGWIGQGQHASSQLYILDLDELRWTKMATTGKEPGPCNMHTAELYENKIYVYRGGDGKQYFSDLHCLDINKYVWECVEIKGGDYPPPRANHASTIINNNIYIFGGWDGQKRLNDLYTFNLKTKIWKEIDSSEWGGEECIPPARAGMKMVSVDDKYIYMFGGSGPTSTFFNDLWMYSPNQNLWHQCKISFQNSHLLSPQSSHSHDYQGNHQSGDNLNKILSIPPYTIFNPSYQNNNNSNNFYFMNPYNSNQLNNHQLSDQNNNPPSNQIVSNNPITLQKNVLNTQNNNIYKQQNQFGQNYLNPRSGHSMTLYKNYLFIIGGSWGPNYYKNYIVLDIDPKPELFEKNNENNSEINSSNDSNQNSNCGFINTLKDFYNNPSFSDVQFKIQGEIIYGHKIILSQLGVTFNTMLTVGMSESLNKIIEITNIDLEIFKIIIKSLYYNNLELTSSQSTNLNILFDTLRICDQYLINKMISSLQLKIKDLINSYNIDMILSLAIQFNATYLISYCLWLKRRK